MDKKLILIACSGIKKGTKCKNRQEKESYGLIERISPSEKLRKLKSYSELTKKRESILIEYNINEISKCKDRESSAIDIYKGRQYKEDLKVVIRNKYFSKNADLLIISTLYGIVHFSDKIYPYNVEKLSQYWYQDIDKEILKNIILEYYKFNNFDSMHIMLSKEYFEYLRLDSFGGDKNIFCYIPLKNGKRLTGNNVLNYLGDALLSLLKDNEYLDETGKFRICNPIEYSQC